MKATIHQPDFMPWLGFFNKIAKVDVWILLEHVVNNPRDAAFWGRRVRILVNGQPTWLSVSLARPKNSGVIGVPVREMLISSGEQSAAVKKLRTVRMAYAAAPFYSEYGFLVEEYFQSPSPSLMDRNMRFIRSVMDLLDIRTRVVPSSDFNLSSRRTQLLVDLLRAVGADTYVCGHGAAGYQQDELFASNGIELQYNRFNHPSYRQVRTDEFFPGLSIIDALFNVPIEKVREWVRCDS